MGNFDRGVDVLWAVDGGSGGPDLAQANSSAATTHRGGARRRRAADSPAQIDLAPGCTIRPAVGTRASSEARGSQRARRSSSKHRGGDTHYGGAATTGGASAASWSRPVRARGRLPVAPEAFLPSGGGVETAA
jgi:hypothetical protein